MRIVAFATVLLYSESLCISFLSEFIEGREGLSCCFPSALSSTLYALLWFIFDLPVAGGHDCRTLLVLTYPPLLSVHVLPFHLSSLVLIPLIVLICLKLVCPYF